MIVNKGLSQKHTSDVIDLLLSTFGEKIMPILGKNNKAKRLLELSINQDNCFSAEDNTELLGVLAFQINKTRFISITLRSVINEYGIVRGVLKFIGLSLLGHKSYSDEIYVEAVAVCKNARGQGVGTELFEALFGFAKENKVKSITLQVIGPNTKAKELYERLGFVVIKHTRIWPINRMFGWLFKDVFLMKKEMNK
jgi:ribosomal protein S18 acetylase RimI-like enzyme